MPGPVAERRSYTAGQYSFAQVPQVGIQRSKFDRSHGARLTFDSGLLIPIFADEALPGDTFSMRCSSFTRMTTPIFPVMDNIYQDFFFFAVPMRLVWDNFAKFMGESDDAGPQTVTYTVPQFQAVTTTAEELSDYLGIPPGANQTFNSVWHRAYNLIWNEWFRAQDLQDSVVVDKDDGPDTLADYVLLRRGKRHDYFTSCLPYTQKGDPVTLPLGTSAPIVGNIVTNNQTVQWTKSAGAGTVGAEAPFQVSTPGANPRPLEFAQSTATGTVQFGFGSQTGLSAGSLTADLTSATAATINAIRQAFQAQKFLEANARGGTRYTEIIRSIFQVVSPDARLQRPEYLGGGSTRINVHPVARTTGTSTGTNIPPVASLGAFATASSQVGWSKSFTEHTLLLGLVQVRADLTYQQGLERQFSRQFKFDFYWPQFAHLGEQAVLNKEIFFQGVPGTDPTEDEGTWGYQERYAEYRYKPSRTAGKFRSQNGTPLDQWHLGIEFATLPALNASFIEDNSPFSRVLAVITEPEFLGDFWFDMKCTRPMPLFSVPGMVDHF